MAKSSEKRIAVTLACEVCKRRNYITVKNKQNERRAVAQLVEHRSPKPAVGGSIPSCPARACS